MRKKNIIRVFLLTLAVTATFLAFSAFRGQGEVAADSSCKENLKAVPRQEGSSKLIWENLSHQFFSTI